MIVAQLLSDRSTDDARAGLELIDAVAGELASVTADAAYDTVTIYDAADERGAKAVVPPGVSLFSRCDSEALEGLASFRAGAVQERVPVLSRNSAGSQVSAERAFVGRYNHALMNTLNPLRLLLLSLADWIRKNKRRRSP